MNNESFNVSLKDFLNDLKEIGINVDKYWLGIGSWDNDTYRLDLSENTGELILKKSIEKPLPTQNQ